jgi:hypothetical protein
MDNCWLVTQSGGKEISKIVVDWFLVVLETPKKKVGACARRPQRRSATDTNTLMAIGPAMQARAGKAVHGLCVCV